MYSKLWHVGCTVNLGNAVEFNIFLVQVPAKLPHLCKLCSPPLGARSRAKMESQASDDEVASEVLSHCSSASESTSIAEEVAGKCIRGRNFLECCVFEPSDLNLKASPE